MLHFTNNKKKTFLKRRTGKPAGNIVYVAIAGEVVNRRSVLLRNFLLNPQESASNLLMHIHAKRWRSFPTSDEPINFSH